MEQSFYYFWNALSDKQTRKFQIISGLKFTHLNKIANGLTIPDEETKKLLNSIAGIEFVYGKFPYLSLPVRRAYPELSYEEWNKLPRKGKLRFCNIKCIFKVKDKECK